MAEDYLRKQEIATLWAQIVANFCTGPQAAVLAGGIGQATAMAQDNSRMLVLQDGRITDLESYFTGDVANNADKLDGKHLNELFTSLSSNTTNAVSITVGGQTKTISQSTLRTSLGLGTAAYKSHETYVTALGVSGDTLTWSKGDAAQQAITIPYATKALKDSNGNTIHTTYLPLTGGTIDSGTRAPLTIKGVSSGARIGLTLDGETVRYIGINESGQPIYAATSSNPKLIWHDGDTNHSTLDLSVKNLTVASTLAVTGNTTLNGTLTVAGASTLASLGVTGNATVGGTLGVTGDITSASNIQATGGVAAFGIAELAISGSDKMPKYYVAQQTASGSTTTLLRYVDAPTYQTIEFTGTSGLRINSTVPEGSTVYYGYPRFMRIHATKSGSHQISINFSCVTDKKSVTLAAGQYVEIMFFEPEGGYITAKWSEIMTYQ